MLSERRPSWVHGARESLLMGGSRSACLWPCDTACNKLRWVGSHPKRNVQILGVIGGLSLDNLHYHKFLSCPAKPCQMSVCKTCLRALCFTQCGEAESRNLALQWLNDSVLRGANLLCQRLQKCDFQDPAQVANGNLCTLEYITSWSFLNSLVKCCLL